MRNSDGTTLADLGVRRLACPVAFLHSPRDDRFVPSPAIAGAARVRGLE